MPFSLTKLDHVLNNKGLLNKRVYTIQGVCIYIEVMSIVTADVFFLHIPRKYDLRVSAEQSSTIQIEEMDISSTADMYTHEPDELQLEENYPDIDTSEDISLKDYMSNSSTTTKDTLESTYDTPIQLSDIDDNIMKQLREVYRQLQRLKLCVTSIAYKICIVFDTFLCVICSDNTITGYRMKRISSTTSPKFRMYITVDLKTFYSRIDTVASDVRVVDRNIQKILDKNQDRNCKAMKHVLSMYRAHMSTLSDSIRAKKDAYTNHIQELEDMLARLRKNTSKQDEDQVYRVKQDIIAHIEKIKHARYHASLKMDSMCFDNTVMLDTVLQNFAEMQKLL